MPERIGPYELQGEIARGALGVVFRARDPRTGRPLAIKLLLASRRSDAGRRRFEREVEALRRIRHPNVVPIVDAGEHRFPGPPGEPPTPWLALELVEGGTLHDRLERDGPLDPPAAAGMARKLALALHACHREGVLHRDVKPSNVLLDRMSEPLLTDFGLAQDLDADATRLTATGAVAGTPGYWAPEQAFGRREEIGPGTDVFGLGGTLQAMLLGLPATSETLVQALAALERPPEPPSARRPGLTPAFDTIVLRCLARDPAERYPTAAALAEDLARALRGEGVDAPRAKKGRWRRVAAALLVVALLLVGAQLLLSALLAPPSWADLPAVPCACERWSDGLEAVGTAPFPAPTVTIELDPLEVMAAGGVLRAPPGKRPPGARVCLRLRPGTIAWSDARPLSLEEDDTLLDLRGVRIEAAGQAREPKGLALLLLDRRRVEVRGGELVGFAMGVKIDGCEQVRLDGLSIEVPAPPIRHSHERYGVRADGCRGLSVHGVRVSGGVVGVLLDRCQASRVQHCDLRGKEPEAMGVTLSRSSGCAVLDCACDGCYSGVLLFRGATQNLIAYNGCTEGTAGITVAEGGAAGVRNALLWNDLSGSRTVGLSELDTGALLVAGNAFTRCGTGAIVRGAGPLELHGNLFAENREDGAQLDRVASVVARGNRWRANGRHAVSLAWSEGEPPEALRLALERNDFAEPGASHVRASAGAVVLRGNRFLGGPALALHGAARVEAMSENAHRLPPPPEDLALGAVVLSSPPEGGPERAVDGDLGTAWDPRPGGEPLAAGSWLLVDLGRVRPVGGVVIVPWEGNSNDFFHRFEVLGSATGEFQGEEVRLCGRDEGPNLRLHAWAFPPRQVRWLRLVGREERSWVRLMEWLVFADPADVARWRQPWLELAQEAHVDAGPDWFSGGGLERVRLLPPALGETDSILDGRRAITERVRTAPPLAAEPAELGPEGLAEPSSPAGLPPLPRRAWWLRRALRDGLAPPPGSELGALLRRPLVATWLELDPEDARRVVAHLEAPGAAPEELPDALRPLGAFPWLLHVDGRTVTGGRWLPGSELEVRLPRGLPEDPLIELELVGVDRLAVRRGHPPLCVLVDPPAWASWSRVPWSPALQLRLLLEGRLLLDGRPLRLASLGPWPGAARPQPGARVLFLRQPGSTEPGPPGAEVVDLPATIGAPEWIDALRAALR